MFWDSGWKHCSNTTVRSSRLLFQDTFSSTIAIFLWQFEQKGQSFLLQNSYFCYSFTNFSFLTVFHVSSLSSVLPVQLPLFHANIALHWLQAKTSLTLEHLMLKSVQCSANTPASSQASPHSSGCRSTAKGLAQSPWSGFSTQPAPTIPAARVTPSICSWWWHSAPRRLALQQREAKAFHSHPWPSLQCCGLLVIRWGLAVVGWNIKGK